MSREIVKKFNEFMAQNTEARNDLDARIAALSIAFAAEKGFEFTAEDLRELSGEDLDKVNGGGYDVVIRIMKEFDKVKK